MAKKTVGFVALQTLRQGPPDPAQAIAEIRRIYFKTSRQTIEHDIAHAIELLRALPDEEQRERATVYMDGLAQMRKEWGAGERKASGGAGTRGVTPGTTKKSKTAGHAASPAPRGAKAGGRARTKGGAPPRRPRD